MQPFLDHYKTLQVHPDASTEVVQAAYKRLSKMYHPDVCKDKDAQDIMSRINTAYAVLNNEQKRKEYHKTWLAHRSSVFSAGASKSFSGNTGAASGSYQSASRTGSFGRQGYSSQNSSFGSSFNENKNSSFHSKHWQERQQNTRQAPPVYSPDDSRHPAKSTLEHYFHCLRKHRWNEAYQNLTNGDREHATQAEFCEWQNTVLLCYEMVNYKIKYYKTYRSCKIDDTIYDTIIEYCVTVTDSNVRTLETSTETLHKYVAFNGYSWRVCLGMSSLKQSILRYRLLADKKGNYDPMDLYHNAVHRKDPLTGLFSESGFYEEAEKEVYRSRRYQRPFSLIVFHVKCDNSDREPVCLCHCASILQKHLRLTDIPARLENNRLICLLAETQLPGARSALRKFIKLISSGQTEPYHVSTGVVFYQGYTSLKDAVYAACSEANISENEMVFTQFE